MSDEYSVEQVQTLRQAGNEINRAYDDRYNWWWRIGKAILAAEEKWDKNFYGDVVRSAVNASGRVCRIRKERFNRIRRTAKKVKEHDFQADIKGCPFSFTFHLIQHYEKNRLNDREFSQICQERRVYMGHHPRVNFGDVRTIDGMMEIKEELFNDG